MIIITGGASGIGQALAWALASREQQVLIVGRKPHTLEKTALQSSFIQSLCADISTEMGRQQVKHAVNQKKISALVNNAGIIEPITNLSALPFWAWQKIMATNVEAPLFLTQTLQDNLQGGRVLNIGSGAAYLPMVGLGAYCVSKAALSMMTRCWQGENNNIAMAYVMPGIVDTRMQTTLRTANALDAAQIAFYHHLKNTDGLLTPDTVADFLAWLLLDLPQENVAKEWDIYDETHHPKWLKSPKKVPALPKLHYKKEGK